MRKLMLLIVVGSLALPVAAWAQTPQCLDCKLGLWDEPELINNTGSVTPGVPKDIFLGIRLAGSQTGVTGVEFSIAGMRQAEDGILVISVDGVTDPLPSVILGNPTVAAPADTTVGTTGTGGMNIAWPSCISGSRALAKVQFLSFTPVVNKVFQVKRRYPPTNIENPYPFFTRCDPPDFSKVGVPAGCYIAGWDGSTNPVSLCDVETAVEDNTWSGMKQLYR